MLRRKLSSIGVEDPLVPFISNTGVTPPRSTVTAEPASLGYSHPPGQQVYNFALSNPQRWLA